jgi:hypothetical protein
VIAGIGLDDRNPFDGGVERVRARPDQLHGLLDRLQAVGAGDDHGPVRPDGLGGQRAERRGAQAGRGAGGQELATVHGFGHRGFPSAASVSEACWTLVAFIIMSGRAACHRGRLCGPASHTSRGSSRFVIARLELPLA